MNRRKLLSAALFGTAAAAAQTTSTTREVHVVSGTASTGAVWVGEAGSAAGVGGGPAAMHFIAAGNMGGKVVKGAPYSAEATTEMTRTLADGTRIVHKHITQLARDKDGRSRHESSFPNGSPFQSAGVAAPRMVTISDPVAKEMYILNYNDKTARKVKMGEPAVFRTEKLDGNRREIIEEKIQVAVRSKSESVTVPDTGNVIFHAPVAAAPLEGMSAMRVAFDSKNMKTEKLSPQTMEGLMVEGTRSTHTIPEGTIGNDRAIVSTNESWYSNDLQMVIFSKNTDPQVGETIYRVQNVRRTEPDASLFKIPADFKVVENPGPGVFQMRRKMNPGERDEI